MKIRKAEVWDAKSLSWLFVLMHKEIDPSAEILKEHDNQKNAFLKFIVRIESPDWITYVCEEDEKIVGFIMSGFRWPEYNQCHVIGFVESLYVLPVHRGKDLYKELIEKSVEDARSKGVNVYEFASPFTEKHIRFYKGIGFEPVQVLYRRKEK